VRGRQLTTAAQPGWARGSPGSPRHAPSVSPTGLAVGFGKKGVAVGLALPPRATGASCGCLESRSSRVRPGRAKLSRDDSRACGRRSARAGCRRGSARREFVMAESSYPHDEFLASAEWLAERLGDARLRIVDARGEADYAAGHIPGALLLPPGAFRSTGEVPGICTADEFAATVGALGIAAADVVVCYDAAGPASARAWWAFSHYGHGAGDGGGRVLNGGFRNWETRGRPTARCCSGTRAARMNIPARRRATTRPIEPAICRARSSSSGSNWWTARGTAQVRGCNARDPGREGDHAGEFRRRVLTGRRACGARRLRDEAAGL